MKNAFEDAKGLLLQQRYKDAHAQFQNFYLTFGQEPELNEKNTAEYMFSLMSYAAFFSGDNISTRALLNDYFSKNQTSLTPQSLFMRFLLAQTCANEEDFSSAAENFSIFRQSAGNHIFGDIAAIQEASMLYKANAYENAQKLLENIYSNSQNNLIRMRARLIMLRASIDISDFSSAEKILLGTNWNLEMTPEIISLSTSALRVGANAFKENRYNVAAPCYRLAVPPSLLIRLQEERYTKLKNIFDTRKHQVANSAGGLLWIQLYNDLLRDTKSQIDHLKSLPISDDETKLQLGQALLFDEQFLLAEACFASLISNETTSQSIREQSFYRLIVTFQMQNQWDNALSYANRFVKHFPNSNYLPEVLSLNAYTFEQKNKRQSADDIYSYLLNHFPNHASVPGWLYSRAMNRSQMHKYSEAQTDFEVFIERYPNHSLVSQAKFWRAICMHLQKQYMQAISAFDFLQTEQKNGMLLPDIIFRKAHSYYALKNYTPVLELTNNFLKQFPEHRLVSEVHILQGNTFAANANPEMAKNAYNKIQISEKELFSYAQFQIGKILKTQKDFPALQKHYESYLSIAESQKLTRRGEAIYWIGFALIQQEYTLQAIDHYDKALKHLGNDQNFDETFLLLAQLQKLRKSCYRENTDLFENWLIKEAIDAFSDQKITYWSRLRTYHAQLAENHGRIAQAQVILLELYDYSHHEFFDAQTLSNIALTLHRLNFSSAEILFTQILERFPESPYRSAAYYGFANLAFFKNDLEKCNFWLDRFETETPFATLRFDASFLRIKYFYEKEEFEPAMENANILLKEKRYRGKQHAQILIFLAQLFARQEKFAEAIAYCQRVYTLYPAFENERDDAYLLSAEYFASLGDHGASRKTLEEFFKIRSDPTPNLVHENKVEKARKLLEALPNPQPTIP